MTVRVYRSTDINAPPLSGQVNKLIDVLSACLVNGYALPTITSINRTGTTATIVFASVHGLVSFGNRVTIAGATQTDYNGEYEMTVVNTTNLSYTVANSPATPATGTITATKPGSGWTLPFTGTNLASFLHGTGGNGRYLRVNDTGTTVARVLGYESMTDVNTGSGGFPTDAQFPGGLYIHKSGTADSTARAWIIIATAHSFFIWLDYAGDTISGNLYFFGWANSNKSGDIYNDIISALTAADSSGGVPSITTGISASVSGTYCARSHTQSGGSIAIGKSIDSAAFNGGTVIGGNGSTYPSPITGGLLMSDLRWHEIGGIGIRGTVPGIMAPLHNRPLLHLDTFSGAGAFAGKKYLVLMTRGSGQSFVEISNTW